MREWRERVSVRRSAIAGAGVFARTAVDGGAVVVTLSSADPLSVGFGGLNHSCDPNLRWSSDTSLTAVADIPEGTELTVDYATAVVDPTFLLYCHCGTYRCRQVIEGGDWRIPQLQLRYAGRWHPVAQELIDGLK